jgi:hypothetical protein
VACKQGSPMRLAYDEKGEHRPLRQRAQST